MLNYRDVVSLVISVTIRGVFGNNLSHRHTSPLGDIEVSDQFVPLFKAILPAIHFGVAAAILIDAGAIGNTTLVSKRECYTRLTSSPARALIHKECQVIHGIYPVLHPQIVE